MIVRSNKRATQPSNKNFRALTSLCYWLKNESTELGMINESVNKGYLDLSYNYRYDDPKDPNRFFFRSDHFNYARKGIPIIFFFDGEHEDYHRPGDSADKIDYQKMEKVARTVYMLLWNLQAPSRPKVDKKLHRVAARN